QACVLVAARFPLSRSYVLLYLHTSPPRRSSDLRRQRDGVGLHLVVEPHAATRRERQPDVGLPPHRQPRGARGLELLARRRLPRRDRKSTRLNSSHVKISYAVFCLKKKK